MGVPTEDSENFFFFVDTHLFSLSSHGHDSLALSLLLLLLLLLEEKTLQTDKKKNVKEFVFVSLRLSFANIYFIVLYTLNNFFFYFDGVTTSLTILQGNKT